MCLPGNHEQAMLRHFGRPLNWRRWQSECTVVSHAGRVNSDHSLNPDHPDGRLPTDAAPNPLYAEAGAYLRRNLAGVCLSPTDNLLDTILVPTQPDNLE